MDHFERELRQAMERRPAPPSLKRKVMEGRGRQQNERLRFRSVMWQRLAASIVLAAMLGGAVLWRNAEQRRKGEAAKQQVFTALRITGRALQQMNQQLTEHNHETQ